MAEVSDAPSDGDRPKAKRAPWWITVPAGLACLIPGALLAWHFHGSNQQAGAPQEERAHAGSTAKALKGPPAPVPRRPNAPGSKPRRGSLPPRSVVEMFALAAPPWKIQGDALEGPLGGDHEPTWGKGLYRVSSLEYGFKMKAKWHHTLWIEIDGRRYSYSHGHWMNAKTKVYDGAREIPLPGKVASPDSWGAVAASLKDDTLTLSYGGEPRWEGKVPKTPHGKHDVRVGFASFNVTVGIKDVYLEAEPSGALEPGAQPYQEIASIGHGPSTFRDLPEQPAVMVGADVTIEHSGPFMVVRSVQPIYLTSQGKVPSRPLGSPGLLPIRVEAKEGYAVGALVATVGAYVDGLRLVFMRRKTGKLKGETLDPADSYTSRWVGGRGGAGDERIGGDGRPIVGLHGMAEERVQGIGVIQPRPAPATPDPNASPLLRDCLLMMTFEPDTFMEEAGVRYVRDAGGTPLWGKLEGATVVKKGKAGAGLELDGVDDCVLLTGLRGRLTGELKGVTIALWMRCDEARPLSFAFSVGDHSAKTMAISCEDRRVRFWLPGRSAQAEPLAIGRWQHVVGVWDGSRQRIYLDGRLKETKPGQRLVLDAGSLGQEAARLGGQAKFDRRQGRFLRGAIDEVGIWGRALSEEEIGKLYRMGQGGESLRR